MLLAHFLFDWLNCVSWNVSMKSNISQMLDILFFLLIFFKGDGHVNAMTLHDVCLHLGKCFFYEKIFLYTSKITGHIYNLFSFTFWSKQPHFLFYLFIHDSKASWVQKKYIQRCSCKDFTLCHFKNISLISIPYWCNVHLSHCNVFILTVKIFCGEKRKLIKTSILINVIC